jgi:DNA repair protein RecN (Recombination protein N)
VNDSPVNLSILRELGSQLIDIHSQHQNVYLQTPAFQMQVLDLFAGQQEKCEDYRRNFSEYRRLNEQLEELCRQSDAAREELDYARYQLEQLEAARLKEGEQEALEQELEALSHAEEIKAALMQASELSGDGEEGRFCSDATALRHQCPAPHRAPLPPGPRLPRTTGESVLIELRDVAADCARLSESTEYEPGRITFIQERLSTLFALQQKYKTTSVAGLLALRDQWPRELNR